VKYTNKEKRRREEEKWKQGEENFIFDKN